MIHILCMVKDGDKYLPDFIVHHLKLVDKIWFIDHSSSNSLDRFKSERIKISVKNKNFDKKEPNLT